MLKVLLFFLLSSSAFAGFTLAPEGKGQARALFVFLHGCKMDGQSFAKIIDLAKVVNDVNVVAYFPSQDINFNSDHCWNWFLPQNQMRALSVENYLILQEVERVKAQYHVNSDATYLVGLSSGAAYSMNLISCFPDKFAGVTIHSGLSYLAATDIFYANQALLSGPQYQAPITARAAYACGGIFHRPKKTLIIHGQKDLRVMPVNFQETTKHFINLYDLLDDGFMNKSFPTQVNQKMVTEPGRHPYLESRMFAKNHELIRTLFVENLEHKWSGGKSGELYADPNGPDVNRIIFSYFLSK